MDAFRAGLQAVSRNARLVIAYIAVSIVLALASGGVDSLFLTGPLEGVHETIKRCVDLGVRIWDSAAYAALNAIVFSMLGADIDRPLWRYHGWRDALRRFFTPWFLLALTYILIFRIIIWLGIDHPAAQFLLTLACIFFTLHIPVGIAIMHQGKFEWRYFLEAVTPLAAQLPRMIIPIIAALYLFLMAFVSGGATRPDAEGSLEWLWRSALLQVVGGAFVCAIAATTWCVLMLHRDEADDDFDL